MSWHSREKPQPTKTMSDLPKNSESTQKAVANEDLFSLFEMLGRSIYAKVTGHVGCGEGDEWCEEVMEEAEKLGLARREVFDPEIHGHEIDAEPGEDVIWTWAFLPEGWQTTNDARALSRLNAKTEGPPTETSNEEIQRERDMWKANHDNQVELKRIIAARPDLKERAPMVEKLMSERNRAQGWSTLQHEKIKRLENMPAKEMLANLLERVKSGSEAPEDVAEYRHLAGEISAWGAKFAEAIRLRDERASRKRKSSENVKELATPLRGSAATENKS